MQFCNSILDDAHTEISGSLHTVSLEGELNHERFAHDFQTCPVHLTPGSKVSGEIWSFILLSEVFCPYSCANVLRRVLSREDVYDTSI